MIKRIEAVSRRTDLAFPDFAQAWLRVAAYLRAAPPHLRPVRATACTVRPDLQPEAAPHDAIRLTWFADTRALASYGAWLQSTDGRDAAAATRLLEDSSLVIVAEEAIMRGADWLAQRWTDASVKLKHMALARRAPGMDRAQFSARWRSRPGQIGGTGAPTLTIPTRARGRAYVQNHPIASATEWPYDAINEVYFNLDDLTDLQARLNFFQTHDVTRADADLVSTPRFVVVEEHVIVPDASTPA